jgi:2-polyprenyl-6-hydroxyphenyl methylase/3-demethylubiquinone-9 3-methyltransferase
MMGDELTQVEGRFAFGENWQSFLDTLDEESIAEARRGLARLFPNDEIKGRRFLDIGCGSGLSMLAAAELGACKVEGVDIDPKSVAAARALLSSKLPGGPWTVRVASVFDLTPGASGGFDIVYSWGVLHHTGDMWRAIEKAAALVAPGGLLALALYRKTPLCGFWQWEKRLYSASGKRVQASVRLIYRTCYAAGLIATGRSPLRYAREYKRARGMDWAHDIHDWLGGYPYQSAEPHAVTGFLDKLGFRMMRMFERPAALAGLLGSHCDEYVALRRT